MTINSIEWTTLDKVKKSIQELEKLVVIVSDDSYFGETPEKHNIVSSMAKEIGVELGLQGRLKGYDSRLYSYPLVASEYKSKFPTFAVKAHESSISKELSIEIVCLPAVLYYLNGSLHHYTHGGDTSYESHKAMYKEFYNGSLASRV